jgi:hypothetical protein
MNGRNHGIDTTEGFGPHPIGLDVDAIKGTIQIARKKEVRSTGKIL